MFNNEKYYTDFSPLPCQIRDGLAHEESPPDQAEVHEEDGAGRGQETGQEDVLLVAINFWLVAS